MQRVKNRSGCSCCGCGSIRVTVGNCAPNPLGGPQTTGTPTVGAVVTVYDSNGDVVGSPCTTPSTGICEIDIPAAGTYDVEVVKSGVPTTVVRVAATCTVNNVSVPLGRAFRFSAENCGLPLADVTITITHTATGTVTTGVTAPGSPATFDIGIVGTGAHTFSAIGARRTGTTTGSASYNVNFGCIQTVSTIEVLPASGYRCIRIGTCAGTVHDPSLSECNYPVAETLYMTDSFYGPVTLQYYDPADIPADANCFAVDSTMPIWYAAKAVTKPACDASLATAITIQYVLRQSPQLGGSSYPSLTIAKLAEVGDIGCQSIEPNCDAGNLYCPPVFEYHWTATTPAAGSQRYLYCDTIPTYTLTE